MKLGMISSYDRKAFDHVKDLGLDFIEVCCNIDEDSDRFLASVNEVKKNVEETGIKIGSLGRWNLTANRGGVIDPAELNKNMMLLNAAAEVGSPVFVCGCNYDGSVSLYKNYTAAINYFKTLTDEGRRLGVKVAVYNCSWENFVNRSVHWKIVLEEVPDLMIKYDCSHAAARGDNYLAELNEWLPRVAHIHLKGVLKVNGNGVDDPPAGMDQVDWPSIFALLYKHGYDAGLSIEPHSGTWQGELGEAGVKFTINYMRPFILR